MEIKARNFVFSDHATIIGDCSVGFFSKSADPFLVIHGVKLMRSKKSGSGDWIAWPSRKVGDVWLPVVEVIPEELDTMIKTAVRKAHADAVVEREEKSAQMKLGRGKPSKETPSTPDYDGSDLPF